MYILIFLIFKNPFHKFAVTLFVFIFGSFSIAKIIICNKKSLKYVKMLKKCLVLFKINKIIHIINLYFCMYKILSKFIINFCVCHCPTCTNLINFVLKITFFFFLCSLFFIFLLNNSKVWRIQKTLFSSDTSICSK